MKYMRKKKKQPTKINVQFSFMKAVCLLCVIIFCVCSVAWALSPDEYDLLTQTAHEKMKEKDYASAIEKFLQAYEHRTSDVDVLRSLGGLYWQEEDYHAAISWYEKVIEIDKEDTLSLKCLGALWATRGMRLPLGSKPRTVAFKKSLRYYDCAALSAPEDAEMLLGKAYAYYWLHNKEVAADHFQQVLKKHKQDPFLNSEQIREITVAVNECWHSVSDDAIPIGDFLNDAGIGPFLFMGSGKGYVDTFFADIVDYIAMHQGCNLLLMSPIRVGLFAHDCARSSPSDSAFSIELPMKVYVSTFRAFYKTVLHKFYMCRNSICNKNDLSQLQKVEGLIRDRWAVYFRFFWLRDLLFFLCFFLIIKQGMSNGNHCKKSELKKNKRYKNSLFNGRRILVLILFVAALYQLFFIDTMLYSNEIFVRAHFSSSVISGACWPYGASVVSAHFGAPFFLAFFLVPLFALLGNTPVALFIAMVVIQLLTIVVLYLFAERFFSRDIALLSSLFLALRPAEFNSSYYFVDCGVQSETGLFSLVVLCIFFEVFFQKRSMGYGHECNYKESAARNEVNTAVQKATSDEMRVHALQPKVALLQLSLRQMFLCAMAGIISGLSVVVCYTNAIVIITLGLFALLTRLYRVAWRCIVVYIFFVCIGLLPLLIYVGIGFKVGSHVGLGYVPIYMLPFFKTTSPYYSFLFLCENIFSACGHALVDSFAVAIFPLYVHVLLIASAIFRSLFCFCRWMWRMIKESTKGSISSLTFSRSSKESIIFLYFAVVCIANILHPQPWPAKEYFMPAYPYLCLILAFFAVSLKKKKRDGGYHQTGVCAVLVLILLCVYGNSFGYFTRKKFNTNIDLLVRSRHMKGVSAALPIYRGADQMYNSFIEYVWPHQYNPRHLHLFNTAEPLRGLDQIEQLYSFFKYNFYRTQFFDLANISHAYDSILYMTIGSYVGDGLHLRNGTVLKKINQDHTPSVLYHFNRGVSKSLSSHMYSAVREYFLSGYIDKNVPYTHRHYYYRDIGARIAEEFRGGGDDVRAEMEKFSSDFRSDIFRGVTYKLDRYEVKEWLSKNSKVIDRIERGYLWKRLGELQAFADDLWRAEFEKVPEAYKAAYISGVCKAKGELFLLHTYFKAFDFDLDSGRWRRKEYALIQHFQESVIEEDEHAVFMYQGLGELICDIALAEVPKECITYVLENTNETETRAFFLGYGRGLVNLFGADREFACSYVKEYISQDFCDVVCAGLDKNIKR